MATRSFSFVYRPLSPRRPLALNPEIPAGAAPTNGCHGFHAGPRCPTSASAPSALPGVLAKALRSKTEPGMCSHGGGFQNHTSGTQPCGWRGFVCAASSNVEPFCSPSLFYHLQFFLFVFFKKLPVRTTSVWQPSQRASTDKKNKQSLQSTAACEMMLDALISIRDLGVFLPAYLNGFHQSINQLHVNILSNMALHTFTSSFL